MLGASLSMLAFVGTLVGFGAWPGLAAHEDVGQVFVSGVNETAKPQPLRMSTRARPVSRANRPAGSAPVATGGRPVVQVPGTQAPATRAPGSSTPVAGTPSVPGPGAGPKNTVDNTAREVTAPVTQQVETVKQQVDAIVEEVGGTVVGLGGATQKSADGLLK
jgi:hypothetical protein